jgi:hypothetical protein
LLEPLTVALAPRTPPAEFEPDDFATCELATEACEDATCDVWDVCDVLDVFEVFEVFVVVEPTTGSTFWKMFPQDSPVAIVTDSVFVCVWSAFPCLSRPYA